MANEKVNKVVLGNEVLIDLTDSTVNPNVLLAGYKAYDASGNAITGEFSPSYHITLTQAQYDQLSQTEKMADENFFYITDAVVVGADIDDTTTSTTKVWSSSKVNTQLGLKANSADVPTKAQITNPNLLDNPWFTINQRGQSSYTSNGYTVDRWRHYSFTSVVVNADDTITLNAPANASVNAQFQNRVDPKLSAKLHGKTVTLSAIINNVLYSFSFVYDNETNFTAKLDINSRWVLDYRNIPADGDSGHLVRIYAIGRNTADSLTVKAVKLEIGSISTLALDTAPNYATELLKCQRYFVRVNGGTNNNGILTSGGFTTSATQMRGQIPLPVQMRTQPAITTGGNIRVGKPTATIATASQISSYSVASLSPTFVNIIANVTATMDTDIIANLFASSDLTAHIDLTADL